MSVAVWDETPEDLSEQIRDLEERASRLRVKAVAYERVGEITAADGCDIFAEAADDEASKLRNRLAEIEEDLSLKEGLSDRAWARQGW